MDGWMDGWTRRGVVWILMYLCVCVCVLGAAQPSLLTSVSVVAVVSGGRK